MARQTQSGPEEPSTEDLAKQVEALRADLSNIAETLKALGLAQGEAVAEDLRARAEELRRKGEAQYDHLHARAEGLAEDADRLVREKPAMAMGIAAGFGFLVGLLMSRK